MKVCVLGAGVMGSGIASLFIQSEQVDSLIWWGRNLASVEASFAKVKKEVSRFARKNSLSKEVLETLLEKVTFSDDISALGGCDLYIEAVVEDFSIKADIFKKLSALVPHDAIVATNTSSLSITALAMNIEKPENFIGIHFFHPTSMMKLVELVKGLVTSEQTLSKSLALVETLDKTPVTVNESPGFIVNRMLIPMINEAVAILSEGVASRDDIDKAMKYGANHPIGPLALADLIGTDVCLSIMETLYAETGDPKYRAHPLLRQYVRAGMLGRKVRKGFLDY
ncbi:3-hydroxyacyl-CoA dehydrogenase family protein [Thalassotalea montiporae]